MSNAIWGDPKPTSDEQYPLKLLKGLLQDILRLVPAYGACLALYDENINQMVIRLHMRRSGQEADEFLPEVGNSPVRPSLRRNTIKLVDKPASLSEPASSQHPAEERYEVISNTRANALFPLGSTYPRGHDLIGVTWRDNKWYPLSHENYQNLRAGAKLPLIQETVVPSWYLTLPLNEPEHFQEQPDYPVSQPRIAGVIVIYQVGPEAGFQVYQRRIIQQQAERISLYLQNDRLRRHQRRTRDHVAHLQKISRSFPTSLQLSELVEEVYRFVLNTVDVSSMLLTLYDRDTKKLYDIFAIDKGKRIEGLTEQPVIASPTDRPSWWQVAQKEKRTVLVPLDRHDRNDTQICEELLAGTWGNQSNAGTLLFIPMKMFTRVVGSLCITSHRAQAYSSLEILVLETMVQIVAVAIENAKLYERPRMALQKAKRREEALAITVSSLLAISTVLDINELLHKFVETVANLVNVQMCSFFQLSSDEKELVAQAIFDRTGKWHVYDGASSQDHEELIKMIRLPFKETMIENLVNESFFYLDGASIETIAQGACESGAIFLRETDIKNMLVIPVRRYQADIVGILAIHTPQQNRTFRPEEIGILMAISSQAAGAIRNAQLFEKIQEAYAELQRMDKIKDEFIVTASHELRTPLSAISGYSSLLKKQSENGRTSPQQILKYANKIVGSTQQLKDLVENMTQAAKMGALDKNLELSLRPIRLSEAAETAQTLLNVSIDQQITTIIADDLWVSSDILRLRQVITNLLDNAAKYSPPQGRIQLIARASKLSRMPEKQVDYNILAGGIDPEVVQVLVCDEGEGIAMEDAQKVFEKFVRAPRSLTTAVRGTGLGLYICRHFIEAMGGRLWLERSIPGQGSIFSFYLMRDQPVEKGEKDESEPESKPAEESETTYSTPESVGG